MGSPASLRGHKISSPVLWRQAPTLSLARIETLQSADLSGAFRQLFQFVGAESKTAKVTAIAGVTL